MFGLIGMGGRSGYIGVSVLVLGIRHMFFSYRTRIFLWLGEYVAHVLLFILV